VIVIPLLAHHENDLGKLRPTNRYTARACCPLPLFRRTRTAGEGLETESEVGLLGAVETAREMSGAGRISDACHAERIVAAARTSLPEPAFAAA